MQSTGHSSTQARSFTSMHGSQIVYVIAFPFSPFLRCRPVKSYRLDRLSRTTEDRPSRTTPSTVGGQRLQRGERSPREGGAGNDHRVDDHQVGPRRAVLLEASAGGRGGAGRGDRTDEALRDVGGAGRGVRRGRL